MSQSCGIHSQSNGQAEFMNQVIDVALHCLASPNPSFWSEQYIHNTLPCSTTSLTRFECSQTFQPPHFPEQE